MKLLLKRSDINLFAFFVRKVVCGRLLSISVSPDTQRLVDNFGWKVLIHGTNNYFKYFKYIFNKVAFFDFSIEFENHANMQKYTSLACSWGIVSRVISLSCFKEDLYIQKHYQIY